MSKVLTDRVNYFTFPVDTDCGKRAMNEQASCAQLLAGILEKIKSLGEGTERIQDPADRNYSFPIFLNVGKGDRIVINREIAQQIGAFAKALMGQRFPSYRPRFSDQDWHRVAKEALGAALSAGAISGLDPDQTAKNILSEMEKQIEASVDSIQEREFVFGCHLAEIPDLEPFLIGPVRFEPKDVWLERSYCEERVSHVARSRIGRSWQGKKLRARVFSQDAIFEDQIIQTVGDGDYVCSVSVGPTGAEAGLQKSLIAARLALATVALGFARPSRALRDMVLVRDTRLHVEEHIEFFPAGLAGWTSAASFSPGGIGWLTEQQWADLASDLEDVFDSAGNTIRCFTHGDSAVQNPKILNALLQALLWFHEGATEPVDVIAVVKFCSSMDALTGGKGRTGISDLIQSHFTVTNVALLEKDLKRLYSDGRSRTVHGTSDRLGHDWSSSRSRAEFLARECLLGSLVRIAKYGGPDEPKMLRNAI